VAQVNVPPQSAATPSILELTAAFIKLWPVLASIDVPWLPTKFSNKVILIM
jgi:hypothetical protein